VSAGQVRRAQHEAELMLARNRNTNREALVSYEAPVPGASRKGFTELEAQFPELQQRDLTTAERLAYNTRLEKRVALESQLHRKERSHDQMAQIARGQRLDGLGLENPVVPYPGIGHCPEKRFGADLGPVLLLQARQKVANDLLVVGAILLGGAEQPARENRGLRSWADDRYCRGEFWRRHPPAA
jgi:hypothetical protein